jgi:thiamine biosynthesis protein ThiS
VSIRLNGTERETAAGTIASLLDELGLPRQTVLVELNGEALGREQWEGAPLRDGDAVEVLRVAAGG